MSQTENQSNPTQGDTFTFEQINNINNLWLQAQSDPTMDPKRKEEIEELKRRADKSGTPISKNVEDEQKKFMDLNRIINIIL